MNEVMKQLHELAVFTAQQIHRSPKGWPKASSWFGRCRLGNTMSGIEQSFLKVGRTGVWLGEDGRLYRKASTSGHSHYQLWGQHRDRSRQEIDPITMALQRLRLS